MTLSPRCWGIAETRAPSEGEPPSHGLFCCITNLPEIPHLKSDLTSLKCIFWTQWKVSRPFTWSVLSPRCSPLRVLPGGAASVSRHPPREGRCPHRAAAGACVVRCCVWPRQTSVRGLAPRGPLTSPGSERQPRRPAGVLLSCFFLACPWRGALLLEAYFLLGKCVQEPLGHR